MKYFLGIDNGGTTTKAVIFDEKGSEIFSVSNKTPIITPKEGYQERDMEEMWNITAATVKQCIENSEISPQNISAVGCCGHGKGLYLWGKDNKPAYNAIASTDHRAYDIVKKWNKDKTSEKAQKLALQDVIECQPVALIKWFYENMPEVIENTKWIFEAKDYIRFRLTNEAFAEITDYSGTCLINLHTSSYDEQLLELFEIKGVSEKLPPIRYSCDICGSISKNACELTGIPQGTPVCGGMFDIDACAIAMGAHKDDDICVITGTWAINEYVSKSFSTAGIRNSLFCIKDSYLIEESSPASAGNMEWIIENFLKKESEEAKKAGESIYTKINEMVKSVLNEYSGIIFLPFLYGTNVDGINKACLFGLESSYDSRHVLCAIFEGVVFCHMNHIDRLLKERKTPEFLKLAGGVAKSEIWSQMFADISGIKVKTVYGNELGGLGCAIAGAVSVGKYKDMDEAVNNMVKISNIYYPNMEKYAVYKKKYAEYNDLIKKLKGNCTNN